MSTTADMLQTAPVATSGAPIGTGDWRLVVEALLAGDPTRLWGTIIWSTNPSDVFWTPASWTDLTALVRGIELRRGAEEPHGRPRVGIATLTLTSTSGQFDPFNITDPFGGSIAQWEAGTVIRIGLVSAADTRWTARRPYYTADGFVTPAAGSSSWVPLFGGVLESIEHRRVGVSGDEVAELTIVETVSKLATINDNALAFVVGDGDSVTQRCLRLLADAQWTYGLVDRSAAGSTPNLLQTTDMADNRLAELYLTADSTDTEVYTDRTGAALIDARWNTPDRSTFLDGVSEEPAGQPRIGLAAVAPPPSSLEWLVYDATVRVDRDPYDIANDVRLARVGGTQQIVEHPVSIGRYGRRTYSRSDLLCTTDTAVAALAAEIVQRRARTSMRVTQLDISPEPGSPDVPLLAAIDVGELVTFRPPGSTTTADPYMSLHVRSYVQRITPLLGRVRWSTTFTFDTVELHNLPGGQLS